MSTSPSPHWLTSKEQQSWRAYLAMTARLHALQGRQLQVLHGISIQDFQVLVHVSEAGDGCIRTSDLADAVVWERSRLSHHLARMEKRGLIARNTCPNDGRGVLVSLTPAGEELLVKAAPDHVELVRRVFIDALGPDGLGELDYITATVLGALDVEPEPQSR